jgi:hypothetical protein
VGINTLIFLIAVALVVFTIIDLVKGDRRYKGHETRRDRVFRLVAIAGVLNFCLFVAVGVLLGGDALNGRVEGPHYFLGSHGSYTEVSHAVFVYSACHAVSALLGMFAAVAAGRAWNHASRVSSNQDR